MAKFYSYLPVLKQIIARSPPRRILEWGPGQSTKFLAEALPEASILSIEHDPAWHQKMVQELQYPNASIQLVRHALPLGQSEGYVSFPLRWLAEHGLPMNYFDLIFVDGRSRCDCIVMAALVVAAGGVVVVHDSERANYRRTFGLFQSVEEYPGTTILSKPILAAFSRGVSAMTRAQIQTAYDDCVKQQKAGRLPAAIAGYQAIVQSDAEHFRAWHLLGVAYLQSGRLPQAIDALRRAIALHGTNAAFHNNLGVALLAQGALSEAKDAFTAGVALNADYADAVANLGLVSSKLGHALDAARYYRDALRLQPKHIDALFNLGNLLFEQGQIDDAISHYQQAAAGAGTRCDIVNNLGRAHLEKGSVAEASDCFARALAIDPHFGEAAFNAGKVHAQMERPQDAARAFQHAARLRPNKPIWRMQHLGLCPTVFQSEAELDEYRAELDRRLDEALQTPLHIDIDEFAADGFVPSFNLAHHGRSNRRLLEKFAALFTPHIRRREPTPRNGKTRVGFLVTAPHVANFLRTNAGIVEHLDPSRFEVTLLCMPAGIADLRKGIRRDDVRYVPFSHRFSEAVQTILAASCDVLYFHKVGTDPLGYLLPFARLAPVQCTGWATHFTSGVPEVDYYLSSGLVEAENAQDEYVERLIRFETLPRYEKAPAAIPPATRGDFGLPAQGSLYLCPQRLAKFHPAQDELLRQVLDEDSTGTIVMLAGKKPLVLEQLQTRFRKTLGAAALRMVFLPPQSSVQLRQLMSVCDALLDIHNYSVSLMARDAFAANLPIVTLPGRIKVERYALGFYRKVGMDDLVAGTASDYVQLAVRLGKDRDYLRAIQHRIAASRAVLFEDRQCVVEFERFALEGKPRQLAR